MSTPDYNLLLTSIWGTIFDGSNGFITSAGCASNIIVGSNPPYSISDFYALYPQMGGTQANITGTFGIGSSTITNVSDMTDIAKGQLFVANGIATNTVINSIDVSSRTITISNNAISSGTNVDVIVYTKPLVPMAVMAGFIYLATSSLQFQRYQEMWPMCMGLFIAHFVTLHLRSLTSGAGSTADQVVAAGLAMVIDTAQSADGVSFSGQALSGFDEWGAFNLTQFGQSLITFAKAIGSGPMLLI